MPKTIGPRPITAKHVVAGLEEIAIVVANLRTVFEELNPKTVIALSAPPLKAKRPGTPGSEFQRIGPITFLGGMCHPRARVRRSSRAR